MCHYLHLLKLVNFTRKVYTKHYRRNYCKPVTYILTFIPKFIIPRQDASLSSGDLELNTAANPIPEATARHRRLEQI